MSVCSQTWHQGRHSLLQVLLAQLPSDHIRGHFTHIKELYSVGHAHRHSIQRYQTLAQGVL